MQERVLRHFWKMMIRSCRGFLTRMNCYRRWVLNERGAAICRGANERTGAILTGAGAKRTGCAETFLAKFVLTRGAGASDRLTTGALLTTGADWRNRAGALGATEAGAETAGAFCERTVATGACFVAGGTALGVVTPVVPLTLAGLLFTATAGAVGLILLKRPVTGPRAGAVLAAIVVEFGETVLVGIAPVVVDGLLMVLRVATDLTAG
jgi:hypothetical protein